MIPNGRCRGVSPFTRPRMKLPCLCIPFLALAGACATGQPGPGLDATVASGAGCEFGVVGGARVVGTGRLHTLGNHGENRGRLGLGCSSRGEGGHRSLTILFNVDAGRGTIPDGSYPILRGGTGQSQRPAAEVLYSAPPVYLAADSGTVTIRRDAEGRVIARVDATTVRRRRPW